MGPKKQVSVLWFGCLWLLGFAVQSIPRNWLETAAIVPSSGFRGAIVIDYSVSHHQILGSNTDGGLGSEVRGHHSLLLLPVQTVEEAMCKFHQQCQGKSRYLVFFLLGSRDTGTSVRKCPLQPTVCCDYRSLTGTWSWKDHRRFSYSDLLLVAI